MAACPAPPPAPEPMAEFVLNVHDIDEDGKDYSFPLTSAWLDVALAGCELRADTAAGTDVGAVAVRAQKSGADIVVNGTVHAVLVAQCNRCLADAPVSVDAAVVALLTARGPGLRPEADEIELTPEDLDREFFTGDRIVLDDLVREQLILEAPMQPLCREDCPGIPVPEHLRPPPELASPDASGRPIDPRLAPLLALKQKGALKSKKE